MKGRDDLLDDGAADNHSGRKIDSLRQQLDLLGEFDHPRWGMAHLQIARPRFYWQLATINWQLFLRRIDIEPLPHDLRRSPAQLRRLDPAKDQFREWLADGKGEHLSVIEKRERQSLENLGILRKRDKLLLIFAFPNVPIIRSLTCNWAG